MKLTRRSSRSSRSKFLAAGVVLAAALAAAGPAASSAAGALTAGATPGGVADPWLWLRADQQVTAPGGQVSQWADVSGSGRITTQPNKPATAGVTKVDGALNFNPVIRFSGASGERLRGSMNTDFQRPGTFVAVVKANAATPSVGGIINEDANGGHGMIYEPGSPAKLVMDGVGVWSANSGSTPSQYDMAGVYRLVQGEYTNNGSTRGTKLSVDGFDGPVYSGGGKGVAAGNNFEVGGRTYGGLLNRVLNGDLAEVLYIPRVLDSGDSAKLQSYLAVKYGITLNSRTDTATNATYVRSDGTPVWGSRTYLENIAAVGRDTASELDQRVSQSINPGDQIAVANGTFDFAGTPTATSPGAQPGNGSFLAWGDNGQPMTPVAATVNGADKRAARVWRTQVTDPAGLDPKVTVRFPEAMVRAVGAAYPRLLVSATADFSAGNRPSAPLSCAGGYCTATVDRFTTDTYFTVGSQLSDLRVVVPATQLVSPGAEFGLTVEVGNLGPSPTAAAATVTVVLPPGLTLTGRLPQGCTPALVCTVDPGLLVGAAKPFTFRVMFAPEAEPETTFSGGKATVSSADDPESANNEAVFVVRSGAARTDLGVAVGGVPHT